MADNCYLIVERDEYEKRSIERQIVIDSWVDL